MKKRAVDADLIVRNLDTGKAIPGVSEADDDTGEYVIPRMVLSYAMFGIPQMVPELDALGRPIVDRYRGRIKICRIARAKKAA